MYQFVIRHRKKAVPIRVAGDGSLKELLASGLHGTPCPGATTVPTDAMAKLVARTI